MNSPNALFAVGLTPDRVRAMLVVGGTMSPVKAAAASGMKWEPGMKITAQLCNKRRRAEEYGQDLSKFPPRIRVLGKRMKKKGQHETK